MTVIGNLFFAQNLVTLFLANAHHIVLPVVIVVKVSGAATLGD